MSIYTDNTFFKEAGVYSLLVSVAIDSHPATAKLEYKAVIYALPACSCIYTL